MKKMGNKLLKMILAGALALTTPKFADAQIFYPTLDSKVNYFKQPNQSKKIIWDTLSTTEQRVNLLKEHLLEDKTNEIVPITGKFESGNFARQLNLNFYGTSGYKINSEDTTFMYDTTNIEKFNIPVYIVSRVNLSNGKGHGMNAILIGNHPSKGDVGKESPLDFYDLAFIEPQTDDIVEPGEVVKEGLVPIPYNSIVEIKQTYWYYDSNKKKNSLFDSYNPDFPPTTFFIDENGNASLMSYDTARLVLERNFAPGEFRLSNPADSASIDSCNDPIEFSWRNSVDRDSADTVKYDLRIKNKGTGDEKTFSGILDTSYSLAPRTLTKGNYEWFVSAKDGKEATASKDTLEFVIRNTPPTPSAFLSPADKDTAEYDSGKLKIKTASSTDADNDGLENLVHLYGPGLDTTFSTPDTSVQIDASILQPGEKYNLEGKVTDKTDTVSFSNRVEFYTPIITGVSEVKTPSTPEKSSLSQNYPNPFNPVTNIRYSLQNEGKVSIKVYDMLGREVETLVDGSQRQGEYVVDFNASKLSSGVYFYRLQSGDFVETKKMILNK